MRLSTWLAKGLSGFWLALCFFPQTIAYFGLAASEPLFTFKLDLGVSNRVSGSGQPRHKNSAGPQTDPEICEMLKLNTKQKRMCKRDKNGGVADTLVEATRLSALECQFQFRYERWNCSSGQYRLNILKKGFKETSFLYAISSAGLVHAFSRACSRGQLDRCTCDESFNNQKTRQAWLWGGCGDNIKFGSKFARKFLKAAKKSGQDLRAKMDQHNSNVGIKAVKDGVDTTCKCHGVSGSCTVRTCWRQLAPFHEMGNKLKDRYDKSVKVELSNNKAKGKTQLVRKKRNPNDADVRVKSKELVHIEESPSFCRKSKYSKGTQGRECQKETRNCDAMCCGRGYNVLSNVVKKACRCQVQWCCYVECEQCETQMDVHMCK
ncbi:protein Wnt-9a [Lingula anatina]|uniref:Protein Wnt n=1 Tax=Lingula anatina TaxID=7574 RepID=A0A1S3KCN0_LINAN|nr:protein Wnt-9a [Lingula anatina]|eukprot:XP_013420011.1 protein Wnt-9a [Lingula anatina]